MPSSIDILAGLQNISNEWRVAAIGWHVALGALVVPLLAGWRPGRRPTALLLASLPASVSAAAWLGGNPFNAAVFAAVTLALAGVAIRLPGAPVAPGRRWAVAAGWVMVAFGWLYPEFLAGLPWWACAYASPLGLIPCPSLAAVVGIALLLGGLGSRAWSSIVAAAGVMYGVVGVFRLGVKIDVVLLAGALALGGVVIKGMRMEWHGQAQPTP